MKKTGKYFKSIMGIVLVLLLWQLVSNLHPMGKFMLPGPIDVFRSFVDHWPLMRHHAGTTLLEAAIGLAIGVSLGFVFALLMERFPLLYDMFYPVLIISQTIPTVAIAPLLVIWFGFDLLPKVIIVVISTLFPITIGLLDGFHAIDPDYIQLLDSMGASHVQMFRYVKLPFAQSHFFSGLRIAVTYSIVGAVIAEWLGGNDGLGVYMTRARKSYSYDEMFAIIIFITALSLLLMAGVNLLEGLVMPWKRKERKSS